MTKTKKKKELREIKIINYFYAIIILAGSIVLTLYLFSFYQYKKSERLNTSYLIATNTIKSYIKDLDTLNQILDEAPSSYFVYLSYTGDENIYEFERHLKKYIDDYKLNDIFYYVDLTDVKNNDSKYLETVKEMFELSHLRRLPAILYINEGNLNDADILDGNYGTIVTMNEINDLLKYYEFEKIK